MMSVVPFNVMGDVEGNRDKDGRWWSTSYEHTNVFFTGNTPMSSSQATPT